MKDQYLKTIRQLISESKKEENQAKLLADPIGLLSMNATRQSPKKMQNKYRQPIDVIKSAINPQQQQYLKQLFQARCKDLVISFNQSNWQAFIKTYSKKNPYILASFQSAPAIRNKLPIDTFNSNFQENSQNCLNLAQLNLGKLSMKIVNKILPNYTYVNLSKNMVDFTILNCFNSNTKELILQNCGLENQDLEFLFKMLIEKAPNLRRLSLSSPDIKDRNHLTKYDVLVQLMKNNGELQTLQLSNIQISPENPIFQACESSSIKHLDLSKNTGVCGMAKNLYSLNLSQNGITNVSNLQGQQNMLTFLNLSVNKIPFYTFKNFLITNFYPNLKELHLNKLIINRQITALQTYMQRSGSLQYLSLIQCELSQQSFQDVLRGMEKNSIMQVLDLSQNKLASKPIAQLFSYVLGTCYLKKLILRGCQMSDEIGSIIFNNISNNKSLASINLSKNFLKTKFSNVICKNLKKSLYNLMYINLQENFVKYDVLNEIKQYVQRNHYIYKKNLSNKYNELYRNTQKFDFYMEEIQKMGRHLNSLDRERNYKEEQFLLLKKEALEIRKQKLHEGLTEVKHQEKELQANILQLLEEIHQDDPESLMNSSAGLLETARKQSSV